MVTPRRLASLALAAIFLAALALRLWHADFGLPYFLHPDEQPKVVSATRLVEQRTLDPAYFKHPALLLYSTAAAGEIAAQLSGQPPTPVTRLLAGRRAVGLFGALTVLATWALGRETGRLLLQRGVELPGGAELCGLLAAAALAVAPLHVATSHYLKEDVPLTLWTTLALLAALRLAAGRAEGRPVQVAFACGLAVSTKYVGVLALLLVPAADWLRSADGAGWRPRLARALRRGAVAALVAAAIFLLLNPWFLADRQRLGQELRFEASHGLVEGHRAVRSGPWRTWWSFHLRRSLLPGATAPLLIAGLAGLVFLTRRHGGPARLLPIAALGWYLAHEASPLKPPPFPDRYMVPLLPLIAVGAATAIQLLAAIPRRPGRTVRPLILTAATMLLLAAPALRSLELVAAMSSDTRLAARAWILGHLLPGSRIAVDSYGPPLAAGDGFELVDRPLPRPGDPGGARAIELALTADAMVTSSFARDRSFDPWLADADGSRAERDFYERIERGWGPPTAVFVAAAGSYGLNNPVVRVFTRPQEPRTGAAPGGSSRQASSER